MMNDLLDEYFLNKLKNPATLGNCRFNPIQIKAYVALYLFYKAKQQGLSVLKPIYELIVRLKISDTIREVLFTYLTDYKELTFSEIQNITDSEIEILFKKTHLFYDYTNFYPKLFDLALSILQTNSEKEDKVTIFYQNPSIQDADIPEDFKNVTYQVFTNKQEERAFLILRHDIRDIKKQIQYESLDLKKSDVQVKDKYSKIFAFPPFFQKKTNDYLSHNTRLIGNIERCDEDKTVFYIQRVLDSMEKQGRAVVLVSNAFLTRNYSGFHKQIIDKMLLREVIHLPAGIIGTNNLMSSLLVFENNPFDYVSFVDARSFELLGNDNLKNTSPLIILEKYVTQEGWKKFSCFHGRNIPYKVIKENDYTLNLAFYKKEIVEYKTDGFIPLFVADSSYSGSNGSGHVSGVSFYHIESSVPEKPRKYFYTLEEEAIIFKCIQDKSSIKFYNEKVDPSQNSFLARFLRISDIQDNRIQDSMSYIVSMDRDLSEYELRARDVLIAKVLPVKTTMLAASDNRRIYPDGNFFIIRLKEDSELTPGYLKGYLESKAGKQQLEKLASGGSMLAITKGALERLEIPYKTRTEQEKYTRKYNEYENQIQQLQQQIQETKDKIEELLSSNDQNEGD